MKKIKAIIDRATDGTYTVYCENTPTFFGMGDTIDQAKAEMLEGIRITKEEFGRENAAIYPEWLDGGYEIEYTSF